MKAKLKSSLKNSMSILRQSVYAYVAGGFIIGAILLFISNWEIYEHSISEFVGEMGKIFVVASIVGFLYESAGMRKLLENRIISLLTTPEYIKALNYNDEQIKGKINDFVSLLIRGGTPPPEFYDALQGSVLRYLTQPLRSDFCMILKLEREPGTQNIVWLRKSVSYVSKNYSGETQPLFGPNDIIFHPAIDIPLSLRKNGACVLEDVLEIEKISVNGRELEPIEARIRNAKSESDKRHLEEQRNMLLDSNRRVDLRKNHGHFYHAQKEVNEEVASYQIIYPQLIRPGESVIVEHVYSVPMHPTDYYTFSLNAITEEFNVTFIFDEDEFEGYLLPRIQKDADSKVQFSCHKPFEGTRILDTNSQIFPWQGFDLFWLERKRTLDYYNGK